MMQRPTLEFKGSEPENRSGATTSPRSADTSLRKASALGKLLTLTDWEARDDDVEASGAAPTDAATLKAAAAQAANGAARTRQGAAIKGAAVPRKSAPLLSPHRKKILGRERSNSRLSFKLVPSGGTKWRSGIRAAAELARAWVAARQGGDARAHMSKQVLDVFVRGVPYQNCSGCKLAVKDIPSTFHTNNVGWCYPDEVVFIHTALEKRVPGRTGNKVSITFLCLSNERGWLHTPFLATLRTLFKRVCVSPEEWGDASSPRRTPQPPRLYGDPDGSLFEDLQTLAKAREVGQWTSTKGQFVPSKIDKIFRPKAVRAARAKVASEDAVRKEAARDIFDDFDANDSDAIEQGELKALGRSLGLNLTTRTAGLLLKQIDLDGSGDVSFAEFWAWFRTMDQPQRRDSTGGYFHVLQKDMPTPDPTGPLLSAIGSTSPLEDSSPMSLESPKEKRGRRGSGNFPLSSPSLRRLSLAITASLDEAVERRLSLNARQTQAAAFRESVEEEERKDAEAVESAAVVPLPLSSVFGGAVAGSEAGAAAPATALLVAKRAEPKVNTEAAVAAVAILQANFSG